MTPRRSSEVADALGGGPPAYVSVFAGRIADTGVDPCRSCARPLDVHRRARRTLELIWASPRELLNIVQADADRLPHHHRHATTCSKKLPLLGKDLDEFSLDTVQMFFTATVGPPATRSSNDSRALPADRHG